MQRITKNAHVQLVGIHTHRTSKTRSLSFYKNAILYAQKVVDSFRLPLKYWDFGGGYYGMMPNKPTYQQYAQMIYDTLTEKNRDLLIIVEPGNAIVASAFDYVSTVIDQKYHNNRYYITTDGTRNDIDPLFHKEDYFKEIQ